MEETRHFITINTAGSAEAVEDETPALRKICAKLDCNLLEVVRSNVLDAGSDRCLVMLADDSGARRPDRKFNAFASSACGQIIFGSVAFGEVIDGPDGGEVVGLLMVDQARVLAFMSAVKSFMIRDVGMFIRSFVLALTLGIASTVATKISIKEIGSRLEDAVFAEYETILASLKAELADRELVNDLLNDELRDSVAHEEVTNEK